MNRDEPPEYQEAPEWWLLLEEALNEPLMPPTVEVAVRQAMEDWNAQQFASPDPFPDFGDTSPPWWKSDE